MKKLKLKFKNKKVKIITLSLCSVIIAFLLMTSGAFIGYAQRPYVEKVVGLKNKETVVETDADFDPFWKAWVYLKEKSINAYQISDQDLVWGAISGLADAYKDPYTMFLPPEDNKVFEEDVSGTFEGIGAELDIKDDLLTIVAPLKGSPAEKAGLKSGDKIIKINETDSTNFTTDEAVKMIRGPKGTSVKLTILRPEEKITKEITITRDKIDFKIVTTEEREDGIFVISLHSFTENSIRLFREAMIEFIYFDSDKLIIDLRGNPGGYLDAAIRITSLFIDEGDIILQEDDLKGGRAKNYRSQGPRIFNEDLNLVVLVDEGSASASEIMAGAIQSYKIGKIVGEKTFGKGSVQEVVHLTEDTSLKITVASWLTPNGVSISKEGITPDVIVEYTVEDFIDEIDPQMDKAVEILLAK